IAALPSSSPPSCSPQPSSSGCDQRVLTLGLVEAMLADHPQLRLHLFEASAHELADNLHAGAIDMAMLSTAPSSPSIVSKPLLREELFVASRWDDGPLDPSPEGLSRLPWIVTRFPHMLRCALAAWFQQVGYEPRVIAEVN